MVAPSEEEADVEVRRRIKVRVKKAPETRVSVPPRLKDREIYNTKAQFLASLTADSDAVLEFSTGVRG